jgi:hypothetical protein
VIDKCAAVIFFANVNTNKANSSQMDYKIQSHDLGNLPHSYYYIKKVMQFVRLVINIRVKERVYSIFENKVCTSHSCNEMHGIKHGICMVFRMPS